MNGKEPKSVIPKKRLLRSPAAAEYLSQSPDKMRRLVHNGELPVVHTGPGAPILFDIRDLDAWVERNKKLSPV